MALLLINIVEWVLIAVIGLCGTLAFSSSGAYSLLHRFLLTHYPDIGHYLIAIIWALLALMGLFSVSLQRKGGGFLTWLALILSSPSILAFNKLDIPRMLGLDFTISTSLSFWQVLILTVVILSAYLLLNFMRELKIFRLGLSKKGAESKDIENISIKSHQFLLAALLGALVLTVVLAWLAFGLETLLLPYFKHIAWNVVLIGTGCLLVLAAYIYWLGTHQSSSEK
jgi:hypothetical protein